MRDVEREGDAGDVGGDQGDGIRCSRFDCVGGEVVCCLGECGERLGRNRSAPPKDCFLRKGAEGQGGFRTARPCTRSRLRTLSCRYASGGTKYENYGLCAVRARFLSKSLLTPYHRGLELRRRAPSIIVELFGTARGDRPAEYPGRRKAGTFSAAISNSFPLWLRSFPRRHYFRLKGGDVIGLSLLFFGGWEDFWVPLFHVLLPFLG